MTLKQHITVSDFPKFFLGFDRLQEDFFTNATDNSYPRYNIVKVGTTGYRIELAVPGWDKSEIDISLHKNVLTINGTKKQSDLSTKDTKESYMHKGLSGKNFSRKFKAGDYIQLEKAYMDKGLLCLDLIEVVPAADKPVHIDIL